MTPHSGLLPPIVLRCVALLAALLLAAPGSAHPLPISSVDLEYGEDRIEGSVIIHMRDLAPELGLEEPEGTPDPAPFLARRAAIERLIADRLSIGSARPRWTGIGPAHGDADAVRLDFVVPGVPPPELQISAALFPHEAEHRTFVNIYEDGTLRRQWLLGPGDEPVSYYAGSTAGMLAVARTFVPAGIHHILIGPDHVLFLIGLLLLGGTLRRLVLIVTAFTIGHSVTLSLAALDLFVLPAAIIEPAIALSIVVIGVDNLMRGAGRDLRPILAFVFGLVHGFGFAYVLREFGLPEANLTAALVSFNVGVEIGQIAIVLIVAPLLALIRRRSETAAQRVAVGGSLAVAAAGAYWFVDRVFFEGVGG